MKFNKLRRQKLKEGEIQEAGKASKAVFGPIHALKKRRGNL